MEPELTDRSPLDDRPDSESAPVIDPVRQNAIQCLARIDIPQKHPRKRTPHGDEGGAKETCTGMGGIQEIKMTGRRDLELNKHPRQLFIRPYIIFHALILPFEGLSVMCRP